MVVMFLFFRDSHNMCLTLYTDTVLNKSTTYIFREINSLKAMRRWTFIHVKVWHNLGIHLFHRFVFECKIQNLNNRVLSVDRNVHGYDMNHTPLKSRIYVLHTRLYLPKFLGEWNKILWLYKIWSILITVNRIQFLLKATEMLLYLYISRYTLLWQVFWQKIILLLRLDRV